MYSYKMDDDVTARAVKAYAGMAGNNTGIDSIDKLIDSISKINGSINPNLRDTVEIEKPDFTRLEDVKIDDDAIRREAESGLQEYKDTSIAKIDKDTTAKRNELESNKNKVKENYDSTISRLDAYYDDAREKVSTDATSRGLARSSIVINELNAFTDEQLSTYKQLDKELSDSITSLDFQINALEQEKENALSAFDVEYATKLNEKIATLRSNLEEKQAEVVRYNNDIAKLEADFNMQYAELEKELSEADWDKASELMDITGKYGSNVVERYKEKQIMSLVDQFFKGRDDAEIRFELKYNVYLKDVLGRYYDKVLSMYE